MGERRTLQKLLCHDSSIGIIVDILFVLMTVLDGAVDGADKIYWGFSGGRPCSSCLSCHGESGAALSLHGPAALCSALNNVALRASETTTRRCQALFREIIKHTVRAQEVLIVVLARVRIIKKWF